MAILTKEQIAQLTLPALDRMLGDDMRNNMSDPDFVKKANELYATQKSKPSKA